MLVNNKLTVYHKGYDELLKIEKWTRYNYDKVWIFSNEGTNINNGYSNNNNIDVRIWYKKNDNVSLENFSIGDILVKGHIEKEITTQQDLNEEEIYNITSITDNQFGQSTHVHLKGN